MKLFCGVKVRYRVQTIGIGCKTVYEIDPGLALQATDEDEKESLTYSISSKIDVSPDSQGLSGIKDPFKIDQGL